MEARRNAILETATASGFNATTECLGESGIFGKVPCMAHALWAPDVLSNELLWAVNHAPPTVYNMSWFSKGLVAQGLSVLGVLEFGMSEFYKPSVVGSEAEIMQNMGASANNWVMMVRDSHMHQIVFNGMRGLHDGIGYLMWDRPTLEVNYPTRDGRDVRLLSSRSSPNARCLFLTSATLSKMPCRRRVGALTSAR